MDEPQVPRKGLFLRAYPRQMVRRAVIRRSPAPEMAGQRCC